MSLPHNSLDHLPEPDNRFKVLGYTRGAEISIEIMDDATKQGVVMPLRDALGAELERGRGNTIEQGTLSVWKRLISEWGPHDKGTAEQN